LKLVKWTDDAGKRHAALVKNEETEAQGVRGVVVAPPDLGGIDWELCKTQLQNALVDLELFTWQDVQLNQAKFSSVVGIFKRWLVSLYREGGNGER